MTRTMPICVPCKRLMRNARIGVAVQVNTEAGLPYFKVFADEKECPSCGAKVLDGFGEDIPHFRAGFAEMPVDMVVE
jgi:hypothetical protein